jgi:hypothetical protein
MNRHRITRTAGSCLLSLLGVLGFGLTLLGVCSLGVGASHADAQGGWRIVSLGFGLMALVSVEAGRNSPEWLPAVAKTAGRVSPLVLLVIAITAFGLSWR